jgi:hypothetical protein
MSSYATGGTETLVNTDTTSHQSESSIAALADGGWVVSWISFAQDSAEGYGIFQQRYDAAGNPIANETQVNTYTYNSQTEPSVTGLADGGWVVTWGSTDQDGDSYGIYQQRFDAGGSAVSAETQVNTYTTGVQFFPSVTALADGGWVVTWQSAGQDGDNYGIYQQRFDADGNVFDGEIHVSSATTDAQESPSVTALADGGWVVTWDSGRKMATALASTSSVTTRTAMHSAVRRRSIHTRRIINLRLRPSRSRMAAGW